MAERARLDGGSSFDSWCDAIAEATPTPAGGSAAALAGALGAALATMVARLTVIRDTPPEVHAEARDIAERAVPVGAALRALAVQDLRAYDAVRGTRDDARRQALRDAAKIQFDVLVQAREVAGFNLRLVERGFPPALGDAATGVFLAGAVARSAYWAIRANLHGQTSAEAQAMLASALATLERIEALEWEVKLVLNERIL